MRGATSKKKLVLLGGYLTHAYLIRQITPKDLTEFNITLVTSRTTIYLPEMIGDYFEGNYNLREIGLNLQQLCWYRHITFIEGVVHQIIPHENRILLEDGRVISYDLLSLDLVGGSQTIEGVNQYAISIGDGSLIEQVKLKLLAGLVDPRIFIIGAGALGVETAFSLKYVMQSRHQNASISIIEAAHSILPGYDLAVKDLIFSQLKKEEIEVILGRKIIRITGDLLIFQDNSILDYGFLIWTGNTMINLLPRNSGLEVDEKNRLILNQFLQTIKYSNIFGSGDNIFIEGVDIPEHFSQYFPQARIILENLRRYIRESDLLTFKPELERVKFINIGNRQTIYQKENRLKLGKTIWQKRQNRDRKLLEGFKKCNDIHW